MNKRFVDFCLSVFLLVVSICVLLLLVAGTYGVILEVWRESF